MDIYFRADANDLIGGGHVMRCLGLAQFFRSQGAHPVLIARKSGAPAIREWTSNDLEVRYIDVPIGCSQSEVPQVIDQVNALRSDPIMILDGYDFHGDYMSRLKSSGFKLVTLDDVAKKEILSDMVVNPNVGAHSNFSYSESRVGRMLLGEQYAILREDVLNSRHVGGDGLLITLGSTDPHNIGLQIIEILEQENVDFRVHLINGGGQLAATKLDKICSANKLFSYSSVGRILPYVIGCDVALCAGGVTASELCYLGVPMSIVALADNQVPGSEKLAELGAAVVSSSLSDSIKRASDLVRNSELRLKMVQHQRGIIDGLGPARIYEEIIRLT